MNGQFQMMQQNNVRQSQRRAAQRRADQARQAAARRQREAEAARRRRLHQQQQAQQMLWRKASGRKAKKRAAAQEAQRQAAANYQAPPDATAVMTNLYGQRSVTPVQDPYLLVECGPLAGTAFPIAGSWLDLGRRRAAPYNLAGDRKMSRDHARIWLEAGVPAIADVGSTNGTFVNGRRLTCAEWLQPGDVVQIGITTLRLFAGR